MSKPNNPPAFPVLCRVCLRYFDPKPWNLTSRDRRCPQCKRQQQNEANERNGQRLKYKSKEAYQRRKKYYSDYWKRQRNNPQHIEKRAARRKIATEIEAGRLQRQPCEVCGSINADAHHDDYSKPLEVRWLCRRDHIRKDKSYVRTA